MTKKPAPVFPGILDIPPYKPGESSLGGKKVIKLSSNENPFGAGEKTIAAMRQALETQHRYPDGSARELREAIAQRYNLKPERIVCGAGSDELLSLLTQAYAGAGDEVLYTEHGFLIYPISAQRVGAKPVAAKEKNLRADVDALLAGVTPKTKLVFIANPNNPTGSYITKAEMKRLRDGLPAHVLLVVDAAYAEYVTAADYSNGMELVDGDAGNVVVTRTFSKIYGLGGLRLGWCYASAEVADVLNRVRGPFNVSDMAQVAGLAAIRDVTFEQRSREFNESWRIKLAKDIEAMGLKVYPSVANFVLVEFGTPERAEAADAGLRASGIIVRKMAAYKLPSTLRITIGTGEENEALLKALRDFCA